MSPDGGTGFCVPLRVVRGPSVGQHRTHAADVQSRIAALGDEIARLTALRDQLAARIGAEPAKVS